jgi:predicted RNase H-like HicB family nuclease
MNISGKVWKSRKDESWLAEVPLLDVMTQAESKEEIPEMVKDAIELLVDDASFIITVTMDQGLVCVESSDPKKLIALMLRRQRLKRNLKLEEVASHLRAKSINEYAQYEQGKHLPSFAKLEQLLKAIDPALIPVISLK